MRRFAILGAFALLALVVVGTVSAASGPKATGNVTWAGGTPYPNTPTKIIQAIFSAQPTGTTGTSAKGSLSLWAWDINTLAPLVYFTGDVTCYYQSGNFARFSGVVTSHTDSNSDGYFEVAVLDNVDGVGNATTPATTSSADWIGTRRDSTNPTGNTECGTMTAAVPVLMAGNLQVH